MIIFIIIMVSVIVFMIVLGYDLFSLSSKSVKTNSTTITPSTNRYISIPSKINSKDEKINVSNTHTKTKKGEEPIVGEPIVIQTQGEEGEEEGEEGEEEGEKTIISQLKTTDILTLEKLKNIFMSISSSKVLTKELIANFTKCLGKKFQCNYSSIFNELRRIFNVDLKEFERDSFNKNFKFEKAQIEFIEYLITNNYKTDNINKDLVEAFLKLVKNRKGWNRALDALQYDKFIKNIDFTSSSKEDLKKVFLTYIYPEASVRINNKQFDQDQINILKFLDIGNDYVRKPSSTYTQTYIFYRMQKYFPKDIRQVTTTIDSSESLINYLIYLGYDLSKSNIPQYNVILKNAIINYKSLNTEPEVVSVKDVEDKLVEDKLVEDVKAIIKDLKVKYTVFLKTPEKFIDSTNTEDLFYTYIMLILHFFKVEIIINEPTKNNTKYSCNKECKFIIDKAHDFIDNAQKLDITDFINKFIYSHKYAVYKSMTSLNEALLNINVQIIDNMANHIERLTFKIHPDDRKYQDNPNHDISKVLMTNWKTDIKERFKDKYKTNNKIYSEIVNYIIFTLQPRYNKILKVHNLSLSIVMTGNTIKTLNKSLSEIKGKRDDTHNERVNKLSGSIATTGETIKTLNDSLSKIKEERKEKHNKRVDKLSNSIKSLNDALLKINKQIIDNMANHIEELAKSSINNSKDRKYQDDPEHDISKVLMTNWKTDIKERFKDKYKTNNRIYSEIVNYINFTLQPRYNKILKVDKLSNSIKMTGKTIETLNKSLSEIKSKRDDTHNERVANLSNSIKMTGETIETLNKSLSEIKSKRDDTHNERVDKLSNSIKSLNDALLKINEQIENNKLKIIKGGYTVDNSYIDYTITDSTQMRINNLIFYNIIKFIRYKYYIKKSNDMNIYSVIFKDYFITLILSIFLFILKMEKLSFGIIIDQLLSIGAFYKYKDHNYLLLPYYIAFV